MITSNYLLPRVVPLGRFLPEGGGGKGNSFQSSEPGGGKLTPVTFGGGSPMTEDTGAGNAFPSSALSCDLPSDMEAIEFVMSLETRVNVPRGDSLRKNVL